MSQLSRRKTEHRKRFDAIAVDYDGVSHGYCVEKRRSFFIHHSTGQCLEVGAGTGLIASVLKTSQPIYGTDLSYRMAQEIRRKGVYSCQSDAERIPMRDNSFDTVIAAEVVYYLDDPSLFFFEAYRVLRPGGRLLLSSFNQHVRIYEWIRGLLRFCGLKQMYFDDGIKRFVTASEITQMAKMAGFSAVQIKKSIVLPWRKCEELNCKLEKTILRHLSLFLLFEAEKRLKS